MVLRRRGRRRRLLAALDRVQRERGRQQRHLLGSLGPDERVARRAGRERGARRAHERALCVLVNRTAAAVRRLRLGQLGELPVQLLGERPERRIQTGSLRAHARRRRVSLRRLTILIQLCKHDFQTRKRDRERYNKIKAM